MITIGMSLTICHELAHAVNGPVRPHPMPGRVGVVAPSCTQKTPRTARAALRRNLIEWPALERMANADRWSVLGR